MLKIAKWIGAALGLLVFESRFNSLLGVFGGFLIGTVLDELLDHPWLGITPTHPSEKVDCEKFATFMVQLALPILGADTRRNRLERVYLENYLIDHFGLSLAQKLTPLLDAPLLPEKMLAMQRRAIRLSLPRVERKVLLHFAFGLANADFSISHGQLKLLEKIGKELGLSAEDIFFVKALNRDETDAPLKILGILPSASDREVHEAYQKATFLQKPEELSYLGEPIINMGKEIQAKIDLAYHTVLRERGIAAERAPAQRQVP